jgi:hypothetical protein
VGVVYSGSPIMARFHAGCHAVESPGGADWDSVSVINPSKRPPPRPSGQVWRSMAVVLADG